MLNLHQLKSFQAFNLRISPFKSGMLGNRWTPYPNEPVATSTKGNNGVGWPSNLLVNYLMVKNKSLVK